MKVVIAAILYGLLFTAVEVIAKVTKLDKEASRKLVHILSGTSAAALPSVMSFREIAYLSLLFLPVMLISKKINLFSSIHQVSRKTNGEIYFPVAILMTAILFPQKTLFVYGLLIMAISDGLASVIGQKYGKRQYHILSAHKSYIGSLTFFLSACLIGVFVLVASGLSLGGALAPSILLALVLTLAEASLSLGTDNLVLPPLASGLLFSYLYLL